MGISHKYAQASVMSAGTSTQIVCSATCLFFSSLEIHLCTQAREIGVIFNQARLCLISSCKSKWRNLKNYPSRGEGGGGMDIFCNFTIYTLSWWGSDLKRSKHVWSLIGISRGVGSFIKKPFRRGCVDVFNGTTHLWWNVKISTFDKRNNKNIRKLQLSFCEPQKSICV